MKIVTYNIRYGIGRDQQYDLRRIADSVSGADVIALQEVERHWKRTGMADQPAEIARLLPDYHWVYGPAFDMDASYRDDNGALVNRRRQFGTMLLSKTPILTSRTLVFPKLATTVFNMELGALEGLIETGAGPVRFYSLHLSHLRDRERILQLEMLLNVHRGWSQSGGAWTGKANIADTDWSAGLPPPSETPHAILLGDFNAEPGTGAYRLLTGETLPDYGNVTYIDEFVDSYCAVKHPAGAADYTYLTDEPDRDESKLRLDYCFVSALLSDRIQSARIDIDAQGSDHFPYWVDMDL